MNVFCDTDADPSNRPCWWRCCCRCGGCRRRQKMRDTRTPDDCCRDNVRCLPERRRVAGEWLTTYQLNGLKSRKHSKELQVSFRHRYKGRIAVKRGRSLAIGGGLDIITRTDLSLCLIVGSFTVQTFFKASTILVYTSGVKFSRSFLS